MIVFDTNVISELLRPVPAPSVVAWLMSQAENEIFTTAITRGELMVGVHLLPEGRRSDALLVGLQRIFDVHFPDRVLPYDSDSADAQARMTAVRRAQGRPVQAPDAMIAGIVRSHGAKLATRNLRDFEGCGIALINPWH